MILSNTRFFTKQSNIYTKICSDHIKDIQCIELFYIKREVFSFNSGIFVWLVIFQSVGLIGWREGADCWDPSLRAPNILDTTDQWTLFDFILET